MLVYMGVEVMRKNWTRKDKIRIAKKAGLVVGGITIGSTKASIHMIENTRGMFYRKKDFDDLFNTIKEQAKEYQHIMNTIDQVSLDSNKKKELLIDSLGLASSSIISRLCGWHVPDDFQKAYELTYPDKAATMELRDAIEQLDDDQMMGFVNGIKGKLFELKYLDYLNDGHLPDGYHATLATTSTQPGWDIAITDETGQINDVIQLKATESAEYIQHALERYPYINIVTTDEVYSEVTMGDMANHLINSGISNDELTEYVQTHFMAISDTGHEFFLPSMIPYAIIAYSVAKKKELSDYKKGKEFGRRSLISYVCHTLGIAVGAFTHAWWLVPVTSVSLRLANHYGNKKYTAYQELKRYVKTNQRVLKRYQKIISSL